jgi:hypothetical protein
MDRIEAILEILATLVQFWRYGGKYSCLILTSPR